MNECHREMSRERTGMCNWIGYCRRVAKERIGDATEEDRRMLYGRGGKTAKGLNCAAG